MTANTQPTAQAPQENSKEINFRAQEKAMKEHYERQLVQERTERERIAAEKDRIARELELAKRSRDDDDDVDSEPYVDHRKLNKKSKKIREDSFISLLILVQHLIKVRQQILVNPDKRLLMPRCKP